MVTEADRKAACLSISKRMSQHLVRGGAHSKAYTAAVLEYKRHITMAVQAHHTIRANKDDWKKNPIWKNCAEAEVLGIELIARNGHPHAQDDRA